MCNEGTVTVCNLLGSVRVSGGAGEESSVCVLRIPWPAAGVSCCEVLKTWCYLAQLCDGIGRFCTSLEFLTFGGISCSSEVKRHFPWSFSATAITSARLKSWLGLLTAVLVLVMLCYC